MTLGRFYISYDVNDFSRFSVAPRQGHLNGIIRIFGWAELVVARVATDLILEYRYSLRMMGCEPDGPALLLADNNSVLLNYPMSNSVLKKKWSACAYHRVREAVDG